MVPADGLELPQGAIVLADYGDRLSIAIASPSDLGMPEFKGAPTAHVGADPSETGSPAYLPQSSLPVWLEQRRSDLAHAARKPVDLELASADEIALALAECRDDPEAASMRLTRLQSLVDDCGLRYVLNTGDGVGTDLAGATPVEAVVSSLYDGWGPELLGLWRGCRTCFPVMRTSIPHCA